MVPSFFLMCNPISRHTDTMLTDCSWPNSSIRRKMMRRAPTCTKMTDRKNCQRETHPLERLPKSWKMYSPLMSGKCNFGNPFVLPYLILLPLLRIQIFGLTPLAALLPLCQLLTPPLRLLQHCRWEILRICKLMKLRIFDIETNRNQSQIYYNPANIYLCPKTSKSIYPK